MLCQNNAVIVFAVWTWIVISNVFLLAEYESILAKFGYHVTILRKIISKKLKTMILKILRHSSIDNNFFLNFINLVTRKYQLLILKYILFPFSIIFCFPDEQFKNSSFPITLKNIGADLTACGFYIVLTVLVLVLTPIRWELYRNHMMC